MTPREALSAWSEINVLDKRRYDAVIEVFGSLEKALPLLSVDFLQQLGCREDTAQKAMLRLEEFDAAREEQRLAANGITFLTIEDDAYPRALRAIEDPPVFLYYKGDLSVLEQPCIGLVGTRGMTAYGKRVTDTFVEPLVRAGLVTISGLAKGIDTRVAEETLRAGGRTVAALGHGFGMIFPAENGALSKKMVEKGGLLLTEFPFSKGSDTYTFPARNRIVAALSLGVIVLEAPVKSGALITADLALDYNREVFAVPGPIFEENYAGCHQLIAKGQAHLVTTPEQVLTHLRIAAPAADAGAAPEFHADTPEEAALWNALTALPQTTDQLVAKSGLTAAQVSISLTMLELKGAARNVGGGEWVRG
jgi:DNA processing protein